MHQKSTLAIASKREKTSNLSVYNDRKARVIRWNNNSIIDYLSQIGYITAKSKVKFSKYWPALDGGMQMNGTEIPWRIFFYLIPLARRIKNRIPKG